MKQLKRLTSVLLVLGMVLGLMPLSAFAAEPENTEKTTFTVTEPDNGGVDTYTFEPHNDGTVKLTGFSTTATVAYAVIPSFAQGYSVTSIGDGAFAGHNELKTVKLPDSVTSVGAASFISCENLNEVNLGNSVRSIGDNAFMHCTSMEKLTIPKSIEEIGYGAFFYGLNVNKKLEVLHYTGTKAQWDVLMNKEISYMVNGHPYTGTIKSVNSMLDNPKEFHYAPTVSFDCGDPEKKTSKVVQYEGIVTPPDDPKADGYQFKGWYTQENDGELFNFNQTITEDVTVYAHWSKKYTLTEKDGTLVRVTVVKNGTIVDITENVELKQQGTTQIGKIPAGAMVTVEANAAQGGRVFAQWNIGNPALMGNPDVTHTTMTFPMPAADVTVCAQWNKVEPNPNPDPEPNPNPNPNPKPNPDPEPNPDPNPNPKPNPDPEPNPDPNPNPNPNPDAKEYTLTEKDGTLVRVTVVENGTTVDITKNVVLEQQGTTQIGKIPAGAMVTVAANAAPEGMVFAQWNISDPVLMGDPDVAHTSQTMTFPMPTADVTVEAMYESAENARETELLGNAAMIGAVGISTVVLAYQAHQLGTELYLKYLLPSGAALPQNRIQLAELLWRNAGEPVPDGNAMYEDIGLNEKAAQQAAQWAVENELMELPDEEHTEQFKPDEQISYEEAIRAWKKAQQLKTAE